MSQPPTTTTTEFNCLRESVFHPRPLELIWIEQAYLSSHAQRHSQQAASWMDKYASVEGQLETAEGKQRRKLRKSLSLLRGLILHAMEQQKIVCARLESLQIELSSRQQWGVLEHSLGTQRLDPRSPAFVPLGHAESTECTMTEYEGDSLHTAASSIDAEVVDRKEERMIRRRWSVPLEEKSTWPD